MGWLQYLRKLYSLDTLDTRFTISSTTPPSQSAQIDPVKPLEGERKQDAKSTPTGKPSLWLTPEFFLYYLVFVTAIPLMFKAVYDVSQGLHAP